MKKSVCIIFARYMLFSIWIKLFEALLSFFMSCYNRYYIVIIIILSQNLHQNLYSFFFPLQFLINYLRNTCNNKISFSRSLFLRFCLYFIDGKKRKCICLIIQYIHNDLLFPEQSTISK